jgi:hypothetical protein
VGAPPRGFAGGSPHFSRLGGAAGLQGLDRGGRANFRGVEARAAISRANSSYGYGHDYRDRPYAAAAAAYADGASYASTEDGCYYMSAYRRNGYRRILVCRED